MLKHLIKRSGMATLVLLGTIYQADATSALVYAGNETNINVTVEGDITADCNVNTLNKESFINMGIVEMVPDGQDFPTKEMTSSGIQLSGECVNMSGAYISVDGSAVDDDSGSVFLNTLFGEGSAEGVGSQITMHTKYAKGTDGTYENIKVGEKYMLQGASDADEDNTLTLEFAARLVYLTNAAAAKTGNYQSVITFNLMIP